MELQCAKKLITEQPSLYFFVAMVLIKIRRMLRRAIFRQTQNTQTLD